jgi:hypothetical protein
MRDASRFSRGRCAMRSGGKSKLSSLRFIRVSWLAQLVRLC